MSLGKTIWFISRIKSLKDLKKLARRLRNYSSSFFLSPTNALSLLKPFTISAASQAIICAAVARANVCHAWNLNDLT